MPGKRLATPELRLYAVGRVQPYGVKSRQENKT